MSFPRPTRTALRQQARTDLSAVTPSRSALLDNSVLGVLGDVNAEMAHGHYGYLDWIARESVPWTATGADLRGWAALRGVYARSATVATGAATFKGTNGSGVPLGLALRLSDGRQYVTTAAAVIASGAATVAIAAVDAGASGNNATGAIATLGTSVLGLQTTATLGALVGGADVESDESIRSRMLLAYANPPQGGSLTDYVQWALAVPSVTHAWARKGVTLGSVVVTTRINNGLPVGSNGGASAEGGISPATGDQLLVANAIYPLRPVTALVFSVAPIATPVTISISNLSADTLAIRAGIAAAVNQVFLDLADPHGAVVYQNQIEEAISAVTGVETYTMTLPGGSPVGPLSTSVGSILVPTVAFA